jgi:hypothetical protein
LALGVQAGSEVAIQCGSRWLQAEDTLAEAGVSMGGVVEVRFREGGGMLRGLTGPVTGEAGSSEEELAGALGVLMGRFSQAVSGIEGAVQRLDAVQEGEETRPTYPKVVPNLSNSKHSNSRE